METMAKDIVGKAVEETQKNERGKTVDQFGKSVEEGVKEKTEELQFEFGDGIKQVAAEAMAVARGYHEERNTLLDPNATVENIAEEEGAAGMNKKGAGNTVAMDKAAMDFDLGAKKEYWERVGEHERIHQEDQAGQYNADKVAYVDASGEIEEVEVGTLVEWHPSSEANKPEDLVPEYVQHVEDGEALAGSINGGENLIKEALKTGDMQALQETIIEEQREKMVEQFAQEPMYAMAA